LGHKDNCDALPPWYRRYVGLSRADELKGTFDDNARAITPNTVNASRLHDGIDTIVQWRRAPIRVEIVPSRHASEMGESLGMPRFCIAVTERSHGHAATRFAIYGKQISNFPI
jgi:hypothetical protein